MMWYCGLEKTNLQKANTLFHIHHAGSVSFYKGVMQTKKQRNSALMAR